LSSEQQFPEPETSDTLPPIESRRDQDFVLTLPQLHRLYTLSRSELISEMRSTAISTAAAHETLQNAFAAVAKNRFSFRSEPAVIDWIRSEARARSESATNPPSAHPAPQTDWQDILRRANISISQVSLPIGTAGGRPGSSLRTNASATGLRMRFLHAWRRLPGRIPPQADSS
jgi:hypothetical protein